MIMAPTKDKKPHTNPENIVHENPVNSSIRPDIDLESILDVDSIEQVSKISKILEKKSAEESKNIIFFHTNSAHMNI